MLVQHLPRDPLPQLPQHGRNLALVEALRGVAGAKGCTVTQLVIAWVAAQGEDIVPLVGARTRE